MNSTREFSRLDSSLLGHGRAGRSVGDTLQTLPDGSWHIHQNRGFLFDLDGNVVRSLGRVIYRPHLSLVDNFEDHSRGGPTKSW